MDPEICHKCGGEIIPLGDAIDLRGGVRRCYHLACFPDEPEPEVSEEDCF